MPHGMRAPRPAADETVAAKEAKVHAGIDSHKRTLAVAVVDDAGRPQDIGEFRNDPRGHQRLIRN